MIYRPVSEAGDVQPAMERAASVFAADPACDMAQEVFWARIGRREYRPEWIWIAEERAGEPPVGAALWWGNPQDRVPVALDALFVRESAGSAGDRAAIAGCLLGAAHAAYAALGLREPPSYHIFLSGDWHDRPEAVAAVRWRVDAASQAGLPASLERLGYEWTTATPVPGPPRRLTLRAEPDDEVFADLFCRVLAGTMDATSARRAELIGPGEQAREDVAFYRDKMHGDRAWWRVALAPDGRVAGFGIPSRNTQFFVVGYLGVLPEHRGHGYAGEILDEITRILATQAGAALIRADTDLGNRPMAAAFERAGYRERGRRLVLSAV